jgi:hypothetical protein
MQQQQGFSQQHSQLDSGHNGKQRQRSYSMLARRQLLCYYGRPRAPMQALDNVQLAVKRLQAGRPAAA